MSPPEDNFVPDDPALYGPESHMERRNRRPLRDVLGVSAVQLGLIVAVATVVFLFLGGPIWSAARSAFPLRLFVSYLVIPVLVLPFLWWNRRASVERFIAASLVAAAGKFAVTVLLDLLQGLMRPWPP